MLHQEQSLAFGGVLLEPKLGDAMRHLFCILIALVLAVDCFSGQIIRGSGGTAPIYLGITVDTGVEEGFSGAGEIRLSRFEVTTAGTVSEFFYYHYGPGNWIGLIYTDDAGEPNTRIAYTASTVGIGFEWGWNTTGAALDSVKSISPGWYWHGVQVSTNTNMFYHRRGEVQARSYTTTFGSPPETWPTASDADISSPNSGVESYAH